MSNIETQACKNTRANQKFWNILVMWGSIWQFQMLLLRLWRWWTTLDCEILNLFYSLQVLLAGFTSTAWNMGSEFSLSPFWPSLIIEVLITWVKFLKASDYYMVIHSRCQHTNYHDTTNHSKNLPWLELQWLCDICMEK